MAFLNSDIDLLTTSYDYRIVDFLELGERVGVRNQLLLQIEQEFRHAKSNMLSFIGKSFLSEAGKLKSQEVVEEHYEQLFD